MDSKYAHILHRARPVSETHPRLSASQRAAQFAPFAALTGFDGMIREAGRQTEPEICLDESEKQQIDFCLGQIKASLGEKPGVCLRYFIPDEKKAGGSYRMIRGNVVKIDERLQEIQLESGENILFANIIRIFLD